MRVSLEDIEVGDLNNVCVMLISKFARVLKQHNGDVLRLRDKQVVSEVAKKAANVENRELKKLYERLEVEIKNHLSHEQQKQSGLNGLSKLFGMTERLH